MAVKTAIEIADIIRRVEYALFESESTDGRNNVFIQSTEIADFWVMVESLDAHVLKVSKKYDAVSGKLWADVKTDIDLP